MESSSKKKIPNKEKEKQKALIQPNNPANKSKSLPTSNLFSALNHNTNVFSQLSSMYTQEKQQPQSKPTGTSDLSSILLTKFDTEIQRILHSLSKRSEITKLKALIELQEILKVRDEAFLESFLPTYTYLYKQLMTCEYDKKLLEEANQVLMIYVLKAKTCLKGQFKEIFPYWFLAMNDLNNEVSLVAQISFDLLFPLEKRAQVIAVCSETFLTNMSFFLKLDLQQILDENNALSESQAFEILDRLSVATFNALGTSLRWIKGSAKENEYFDLFCKTLDLDKDSVGLIKILEILENKKRGLRSRAAVLDLLAEIYDHLQPETHFSNQVLHITKAVFSLIDDKERILQQALWNKCFVLILKKTPENIWKKICDGKQRETFINRLLECFKKAGQGIGSIFYEKLTIILSLLPFAKIKGETNEEALKWKLNFIKNYMEAIWAGILHEEIKFFSENLVSTYFECLYFLNIKRFPEIKSLNLPESALKFSSKILKGLLQNPLEDFLKNYMSSQPMSPYKTVPKRLSEFFENVYGASEQQNDFFKETLKENFSEIRERQKNFKTFAMTENFCLLLRDLLVLTKDKQHIELIIEIEQLMIESYREGLKKFVEGFGDKFDDVNAEKIVSYMKLYLLISNELKTFVQNCSENSKKSLQIMETFKIMAQILEKILANLGSIFKISNFERIASNFSKILRLLFSVSDILNLFIVEEEKNTYFEIFPKLLNEKFITYDQLSIQERQNILILITFCLDPNSPENLFTDFQALSQNVQQQDALIWKTLENYIKKNKEEKILLIQNSQLFQELLISYIESFYNMKSFSNGLVMIPCTFIIFRDVLEESRLDCIIEKASFLAKEFLNKPKIDSFEKLKNIYMVKSFLLVDSKIIPEYKTKIIDKLFQLFFQIIIKAYSLKNNKDLLDHYYDFIGIIEQKSNLFQTITNISFQEFSVLIANAIKTVDDKNTEITIEAICDFLEFLKTHKKSQDILYFFNEILLKPLMFKDSLGSKTIWLILKGCLDIVSDYKSFDEIFSFQGNHLKEIWLISLLLSAPNTYALFNQLGLKKFYQETVRKEILSLIIQEKEKNHEYLLKIFEKLLEDSEEKSLIFVNGLKFLLKSLDLKNCHQVLKENLQNNLQKYVLTILEKGDNISEKLFRKSLISKTILLHMETCLIPSEFIEKAAFKLNAIVTKPHDQKILQDQLEFLINLDLLLTIHPLQSLSVYLNEDLIEKLIKHFFENLNVNKLKNLQEIPHNFFYGIAFDFFNFVTEEKTFVVLSDHISAIEGLIRECLNYNRQPKKFYIRSLISCNSFLRKILGFLEGFTEDFRSFINKDLLFFFVERLKVIKEEGNEEVMLDESNDQMIVEFAETINRFGILLTKAISEKIILELILTPFPAIQKASFNTLKLFYQNIKQNLDFSFKEDEDPIKAITKLIPENILQFLETSNSTIREWNNEESLLNPKIYSFLLIWISFLLKINSPLSLMADLETMKRLFKDYCEKNNALYSDFLGISFQTLKILDPYQSGIENSGSKGSVIIQELMKIEIEWTEFLSKDSLIKLMTHGLYQFSLNFPSFIRKWSEESDKKYLKTADFYLKSYISPALFLSEIETIEMRQQEWKSEEFNIYVAKNTREINAIFTKESSQLEINLKIPYDYPLRETSITCEREVKLQENKINRWIMRMKSLLRTENNSILNLLLIWKQNLEKEFEGTEECPICYYVIHSSTKEIPKLACKTCSHKFHSSCIHKWFNSSNKSECPLCKSQFL